MTPINKILSGVLALQVVVAAITWVPRGSGPSEPSPLMTASAADITRITIVGRTSPELEDEPDQVTLSRAEAGWSIEDLGGYPADVSKVDEVLESLASLVGRSPTATTVASHYSLQVADDTFTRKITLTTAEGEQVLYIGAATGSGLHVRDGKSEDVYTTRGVSAWSIADQDRRYFDTKYLVHTADQIDSFRVKNLQGDHTLIKVGDAWQEEGALDPAAIEASEAASLVRTLMNLRVDTPTSAEPLPEHGLGGSVRVEWTVTEDETTTSHGYTVGAPSSEGKRYVRSDADGAWVIEVLDSTVARAVDTEFAFLGALGAPLEE